MEILIFITGMLIPVAINLFCFRTYPSFDVICVVLFERRIIRIGKDWCWQKYPYEKPT